MEKIGISQCGEPSGWINILTQWNRQSVRIIISVREESIVDLDCWIRSVRGWSPVVKFVLIDVMLKQCLYRSYIFDCLREEWFV